MAPERFFIENVDQFDVHSLSKVTRVNVCARVRVENFSRQNCSASGCPHRETRSTLEVVEHARSTACKSHQTCSVLYGFLPTPNAPWSLFSRKSSMAIFWSSVSFLQCFEEKSCKGIWKARCLARFLAPSENCFGTTFSGNCCINCWIWQRKKPIQNQTFQHHYH